MTSLSTRFNQKSSEGAKLKAGEVKPPSSVLRPRDLDQGSLWKALPDGKTVHRFRLHGTDTWGYEAWEPSRSKAHPDAPGHTVITYLGPDGPSPRLGRIGTREVPPEFDRQMANAKWRDEGDVRTYRELQNTLAREVILQAFPEAAHGRVDGPRIWVGWPGSSRNESSPALHEPGAILDLEAIKLAQVFPALNMRRETLGYGIRACHPQFLREALGLPIDVAVREHSKWLASLKPGTYTAGTRFTMTTEQEDLDPQGEVRITPALSEWEIAEVEVWEADENLNDLQYSVVCPATGGWIKLLDHELDEVGFTPILKTTPDPESHLSPLPQDAVRLAWHPCLDIQSIRTFDGKEALLIEGKSPTPSQPRPHVNETVIELCQITNANEALQRARRLLQPPASVVAEAKAAAKAACQELVRVNHAFFEARTLNSFDHSRQREAALGKALKAIGQELGVDLEAPLYIDANGEFSLIALSEDPKARAMRHCAPFGSPFVALLNAHQPRMGIVPGTLSPENGWCRMNHFAVEKLVMAYAGKEGYLASEGPDSDSSEEACREIGRELARGNHSFLGPEDKAPLSHLADLLEVQGIHADSDTLAYAVEGFEEVLEEKKAQPPE